MKKKTHTHTQKQTISSDHIDGQIDDPKGLRIGHRKVYYYFFLNKNGRGDVLFLLPLPRYEFCKKQKAKPLWISIFPVCVSLFSLFIFFSKKKSTRRETGRGFDKNRKWCPRHHLWGFSFFFLYLFHTLWRKIYCCCCFSSPYHSQIP